MVDHYDWILLALTTVLTAGFVLGLVTSVPMNVAMAGSVILSTPIVYEALFRNPPTTVGEPSRAVAAIAWHAILAWSLFVMAF